MSKNKRAPEHLSYDNGDNNVKEIGKMWKR